MPVRKRATSKRRVANLALAAFFLSLSPALLMAQEPDLSKERKEADEDTIFTVEFDNDIFTGSDNNYTNGFRLSVMSAETDVPDWLEDFSNALPFFAHNGHKRWGFEFGQSMYTPDNITLRNPPADDQPYAGWLYGSANLISDTGQRLDNLQLTLGVVGPASGAEQTQEFIHDLIGSPHPNGWHNQLENEPGIVLTYERKWRNYYEFTRSGWGIDFTPSVGGSLGNIYTNATTGGVVRFGQDLPADYGPPLIRPNLAGTDFFIPQEELGWYLFAGVQGSAVARNIFLDGNTFEDSASVDKRPFVGGVQLGMAVVYRDVRVAYTHVMRTREFDHQNEADAYGALTVSTRF